MKKEDVRTHMLYRLPTLITVDTEPRHVFAVNHHIGTITFPDKTIRSLPDFLDSAQTIFHDYNRYVDLHNSGNTSSILTKVFPAVWPR